MDVFEYCFFFFWDLEIIDVLSTNSHTIRIRVYSSSREFKITISHKTDFFELF